ncbi:MAG: DUF4296 domain-containing protein [Bacteroidetes bacterium]|nr:DUF4296 domain-containing protein [Bacteroidota bacterium]MBS1931470.1 DUF4296 domain-containing protein [Bacteroidota bacterium]
MKNYFPFLFLAFLVFSCSGKKTPNGVLTQKEMVAVLWDMFRVDEFLTGYVLPADSMLNKKDQTIGYYEEVFKLHKIDKTTFQKSFTFYKNHPILMQEVLDSLNTRSTSPEFEQDKPVIKDSIRTKKMKATTVQ